MYASRFPRSGLSLLEVMLAIAILGGALVAIGELTRIGSRSAMAAREMTSAQLFCESKMAEVVAGIMPAEPVGPVPCESDPSWRYSIETLPSNHDGMLAIKVTFEQDLPPRSRPISFSLTRWMMDPQRVLPTTSSSSSSSGGSTSSSGGSSSGGPAAGS